MNPIESRFRDTFGHDTFRPGQREVVEVLVEGRSALAVFPTGGGKSLCYQLPALLFEGVTLVISPLIALMKDQVESLVEKGIEAARLDSTLSSEEVARIYGRLEDGSLKLLYVAPERLGNEGFLRRLRKTQISLMAVDEAHCISEWGHNFRPDYLKLAEISKELQVGRILALTATATPRVVEDIGRQFEIREKDRIVTGFARPNLSYHITPCEADERDEMLSKALQERVEGAAVVYVTLQRTAEEVAGMLVRNGIDARAYHAGMKDEHRAEVQDRFMDGSIRVVVATIAFGMGVDKADIRSVFHYNLPKSLENYVQESGRAGRDGEPAHCEILACLDDLVVLENFVYGGTPSATALKSLVSHVLGQGREFSVSRYELSVSRDIRPLVVATALTYLELERVVKPLGPFYASYRYRMIEPLHRILAGHDGERKEFLGRLFEISKKGRTWYSVEVAEASMRMEQPETRIRKALQHLADAGEIELQPSGLRHGYLLEDLAGNSASDISGRLISLFERREQGEIERLGRVVHLCESGICLPQALSAYFGETTDLCGQCSSCLGTNRGGSLPGGNRESLSSQQVELMNELHRENHMALRQARQLARFFCGLSSPATTRARLHRDPRFGALSEFPFEEVLLQANSLLPK